MGRFLCSLLLLLVLPGVLNAETYIVRPDGTGDFPTIQAAVDAAVDGDAIELTEGVFRGEGNGNVTVYQKGITIRSQSNDPTVCILDAEGTGRVMWFGEIGWEEPGLLEGITLANGSAPDWGGGLSAVSSHITVRRCIFSGNYAPGNAGAAMLDFGWVTFVDCTFVGNEGAVGGALCT